jgi:hypothetical protein
MTYRLKKFPHFYKKSETKHIPIPLYGIVDFLIESKQQGSGGGETAKPHQITLVPAGRLGCDVYKIGNNDLAGIDKIAGNVPKASGGFIPDGLFLKPVTLSLKIGSIKRI